MLWRHRRAPSRRPPTRCRLRPPVRQPITLELVSRLTPSEVKADQMSATFGLEPVAHAAVEPETRNVAIERTTLRSDAEVREWAKRAENQLLEEVKKGPVLVS